MYWKKTKRKFPVIQAKTRLNTAQNKMKLAIATIRVALDKFNGLTDATDKEVAANQINYSWKRLISGEEDLRKATDKLTEVLGEADPTIMEGDVSVQIDRDEECVSNQFNQFTTNFEDDLLLLPAE